MLETGKLSSFLKDPKRNSSNSRMRRKELREFLDYETAV